jgi:hypothetical protein
MSRQPHQRYLPGILLASLAAFMISGPIEGRNQMPLNPVIIAPE